MQLCNFAATDIMRSDPEAEPQLEELNLLKNRVINNSSSIKAVLSQCGYDSSDYSEAETSYFRKAFYISDNIPDVVYTGSQIDADIFFMNQGMFYSWNLQKNIKLRMEIRDQDNELVRNEFVNLDITDSENVPGEEIKNQDYEKIKVFHTRILFDVTEGIYDFLLVISDGEWDFQSPFHKKIRVVKAV